MKNIFLVVLMLLYFSPSHAAEKTAARVVKVTDGDTIEVLLDNKKEAIRLLGVDCYETYPNNREYKQAYTEGITVEKVVELGKLAKYYVQKELKPDDMVYLEFEENKRDSYGRLLAYVYLKDGKMLNKMLLHNKKAKYFIYETCEKKNELIE